MKKQKQKKRKTEGELFQEERKKQMNLAYRIINPVMKYDSEYDLLYLWFGGRMKVKSTIELSNDTRVDISRKGNIVAIEICNFKNKMKGEKL